MLNCHLWKLAQFININKRHFTNNQNNPINVRQVLVDDNNTKDVTSATKEIRKRDVKGSQED